MKTALPALTPAFDKAADSALLQSLPEKLRAPFAYVLEKSVSVPELSSFPTFYISALLGSDEALKRVLQTVFAVHGAAKYIENKEQLGIANTVIYLGNALAAIVKNGGLNQEKEAPKTLLKDGAAATMPTTTQKHKDKSPVGKAATKQSKRTKPVINPTNIFLKPGTLSTE